jgi:hypothetical protein
MCARALPEREMRGRTLLPPVVITSIVDAEASVLCVCSDLRKLSMSHTD